LVTVVYTQKELEYLHEVSANMHFHPRLRVKAKLGHCAAPCSEVIWAWKEQMGHAAAAHCGSAQKW